MSDKNIFDRLVTSSPARCISVACALELIKADLESNPTHTSNRLNDHMLNLSSYADKIDEALKTE